MDKNLRDLIDYTPRHLTLIQSLESLGIDPTLISNPDLSMDIVTNLAQLLKYNIEIPTSDVMDMTRDDIQTLLQLGRVVENPPQILDLIIWGTNAGLELDECKTYDLFEEHLSRRLDKELDKEGISQYLTYKNGMETDTWHTCIIKYALHQGCERILQPHNITRNFNIGFLLLEGIPSSILVPLIEEYDEIDWEIDDSINIAIEDLNTEIRRTGAIRFMNDTSYTIGARRTLLGSYINTGIDYRLTNDKFNVGQTDIDDMDTFYLVNEPNVKELVETIQKKPIEQQKELREMSNIWRKQNSKELGVGYGVN